MRQIVGPFRSRLETMANDDPRRAKVRLVPLMLTGCLAMAACTSPHGSDMLTDERRFDCDDGRSFTASFSSGRVRIDTKGYSYDLEERPASVGVRYGGKRVAFAQDEDRAVLIGAADGPYKGCTESGFRIDR